MSARGNGRGPTRRKAAIVLTVTLAGLLLVGCTSPKTTSSGGSAAVGATGKSAATGGARIGAPAAAPPGGTKAATPLQQRDIVRTATVAVSVADVDRAADALVAQVNRSAGRVDGDRRTDTGAQRSAQLVLRLLPAELDPMITAATRLGRETSRSVQGEDVTSARADVEARVLALTASVDRLRQFLKNSGSVADLVALEGQLSQRESELESTVAQQRALADQISLATLTVDLTATIPRLVAHPHGPAGFGSALAAGWRGMSLAFRLLAAAAGYALPFLLIASILAVPVWITLRRRQRTSGVAAGPASAESSG
jgi:hypothetical protein